MSLFRTSLSAVAKPAAAPSLRAALPRQSLRGFADQAPRQPSSSSSNLPLILGVAGLSGLGYYAYTGGIGGGSLNKATKSAPGDSGALAGALNPKEFKEFVLKEVKPYNHDSATYVFELPDNAVSGMRVASAVVVKGAGDGITDKEGKQVIRPYTPVTEPDTPGHIDFLIKRYGDGNMSQHIHKLKPGDKLAIKGPIDKFQYKPNTFENVGMIAGGTGITPMWQVIQAIAKDPQDKTNVTLVYTNKTDSDILLREQFDQLAAKDSRFKIVYGVDKASSKLGQDSFKGYVTPEIISKHMPAPGKADKVKVFVCGPPPQVEAICGAKGPKGSQGDLKGLLADAGYQPDQV